MKSNAVPSAAAKKPRGRPARPMPAPIDADPRAVARAIMARPPKKAWRYLQDK